MVDVRPYMQEHPFVVQTHDSIEKCLEIFRSQSLRHLCVCNPHQGAVVGVITRKDLFNYMTI